VFSGQPNKRCVWLPSTTPRHPCGTARCIALAASWQLEFASRMAFPPPHCGSVCVTHLRRAHPKRAGACDVQRRRV
jgi:hypothetical protein